jgi:hypothetical protein
LSEIERYEGTSGLSDRQHKALRALLVNTTVDQAAEACGLGVSTIRRYMSQDEFAAEYRRRRALLLSETVGGVVALGGQALEVLEAGLKEDQDPAHRQRAARMVLDYITKLVELDRRLVEQDELIRRIEELERAQDTQRNNGYRGPYLR